MPIEQTPYGGTMITGDSIMDYRYMMLITGLRSEIKGFRLTSKGSTCYAILKREFGFKGSKAKVLAQAEARLEEVKKEKYNG